jgi:hypothetical protein
MYVPGIALQLCRDIERQSLANLHILGSKMGDCARTAVFHLSEKKEGDPKTVGQSKFRSVSSFAS